MKRPGNNAEECLDFRRKHQNVENFLGESLQTPPARGCLTPYHTFPQQRLWRRLIGFADSFQSPSWLDPPPLSKILDPPHLEPQYVSLYFGTTGPPPGNLQTSPKHWWVASSSYCTDERQAVLTALSLLRFSVKSRLQLSGYSYMYDICHRICHPQQAVWVLTYCWDWPLGKHYLLNCPLLKKFSFTNFRQLLFYLLHHFFNINYLLIKSPARTLPPSILMVAQ